MMEVAMDSGEGGWKEKMVAFMLPEKIIWPKPHVKVEVSHDAVMC